MKNDHDASPTIFELSRPGRRGPLPPPLEAGMPEVEECIPARLLRRGPIGLPEVSELDAVRHYTRLSTRNFAIDNTFYPLGSCTMKYNPRINEVAASKPGFAFAHPLTGERLRLQAPLPADMAAFAAAL